MAPMRFIQQLDPADCGAACLAMMVDHFGGSRSIASIRQLAGTDTNGTNLAGMIRAGESMGFETRALKGPPEALPSILKRPLIAHLRLRQGEETIPHFVVIKSLKGNRVTIYDPAFGIVKQSIQEFERLWTGYVIVLAPREDYKPVCGKKGLFARFLPTLRPFTPLLVLVGIASMLLVACGIIGSFYFRYLIDEILPARSSLTLHAVSCGLLLMTALQVVLDAVRKKLLLFFALRLDNGIIYAYFHHVLGLPLSFFDSRMTGDVVSRLSQISEIREALSDAALTLVMDSLMVAIVGSVLFLQSMELFIVSVVSVPLVSLVIWIFARFFSSNYQQLMANSADVHASLVEVFSGMSTIKAFGAEDRVKTAFDEKQSKVIWSHYRLGSLEACQGGAIALINGWSGNLTYWLGSALILKDAMSLGQLISFSVLLGFFLGPLQRLVNLQPSLQRAFVAADRVGEFFDLQGEGEGRRSRLPAPSMAGRIEFDQVRFRYGTRRPVLDGLTIQIPPGKQIAFVGPSGSGKSTLVKLLLKFYSPEEGQISVNGVNLQDIDTTSLRRKIGYVPQDVFLFSGTIAENIALGHPEVSFGCIMEASQRAGALEFINRQSARFDTILTERGGSLSGGERQRIALARALVGDPDLIVFDEATSNLDAIAERTILDTLKGLRELGKTIIVVAHRLPTIIDSDLIGVLVEGRIEELGRHAELLAMQGAYYSLWQEGSL